MQDINKQEDILLISKIQDKIKFCVTRNNVENTDFLNMHEKDVARKFLEENSIDNYFFFGGYETSEREMLFLYPEKLDEVIVKKTIEQYITAIRITLPKIENFSHREYLGGIMKLGVDRKKVGDIIVTEKGADIIISTDITKFLETNLGELTRFNKAKIEQININDVSKPIEKIEEYNIIVPSMRLDSIVAQSIGLSRTKTSEVISQGRVFVNAQSCLNNSKNLKVGDFFTIRGKGRFLIKEQKGNTRKNKIVLIMEKKK